MTGSELNQLTETLTSSPIQFDAHCVLNSSVEHVFDVITDFENLPRWMPLIRRVEVDNSVARQPGETGSVRVIYPQFGRPALETVKLFRRPNLLAYSADDASLRGMYRSHTGILSLQSVDGNTSRLTWRTCAIPGNSLLPRLIGRRLFPWIIHRSQRNLKRLFE